MFAGALGDLVASLPDGVSLGEEQVLVEWWWEMGTFRHAKFKMNVG